MTTHNIACTIDWEYTRTLGMKSVWSWGENAAVLFVAATALSPAVSPCQAEAVINTLSARRWHAHAFGTALEHFSKTCIWRRLVSLLGAICYFGACWGKCTWRSHGWQTGLWKRSAYVSAGLSYVFSKLFGCKFKTEVMPHHSYVWSLLLPVEVTDDWCRGMYHGYLIIGDLF